MSLSSSSSVPNLPLYRRNNVEAKPKRQDFHFSNGYAVRTTEIEKAAKAEALSRVSSLPSLAVPPPTSPMKAAKGSSHLGMSSPPDWLVFDKQVLLFNAYFKEAVFENPVENHKVRKCNILYYLTDNTIHVSEPKVENSGMPQGIFLKRHKIMKEVSGKYYTLADLVIGRDIAFYGRVFHITGCNESTSEYLFKNGFAVGDPASEAPEDLYTTVRARAMQRETGADTSVYRGVMKNPSKTFVEASLGRPIREREALAKYLSNDKKVLRFYCAWDDRDRLYGTLTKFTLHFFLADDKVEILEVHSKNSGKESFPRLLLKDLLPYPGETRHYKWTDFSIGSTVSVYGREIHVLDCDEFTRQFYEDQGRPLSAAIVMELPPRALYKHIPPPHLTGIGSEADSLGSCYSLNPKPPKKDIVKLLKLDRKVLNFAAKFAHPRVEDKDRKFTISFYLADDSVAVMEPPQRNSGIVGGKFLSRAQIKKADGTPFKPEDFKVGEEVGLLRHTFIILEADEFTKKWMTGSTEHEHNIPAIIKKLSMQLRKHTGWTSTLFRSVDSNHSGTISFSELKTFLETFLSGDALSHREMMAIMSYFDKDGMGSVDVREFAAVLAETDVMTTSHEYGDDSTKVLDMPDMKVDYADILARADDVDLHFFDKPIYQFASHCRNRGISLHHVFQIFATDVKKDGKLGREEFKKVIESSGFIPGGVEGASDEICEYFFNESEELDVKTFREHLIAVFKDFDKKEKARLMRRATGDVGY